MESSNYFLDASTEKGETHRLDVQHQLWQILLQGRLLTAPYTNAASILDLGCGSAVWTAAVARNLPGVLVTGVDITPPANDFGLKNLSIVEADIEKPWNFAIDQGGQYDIITLRVLVSAIGNWPSLIQKCYEHLKPGGWIEVQDITIGTFSDTQDWRDESSPLMRWYQCYRKGASEYGIEGFANQTRKDALARAQYINVTETFYKCPFFEDANARSDKEKLARLARENVLGLLEAVTKHMIDRIESSDLGMSEHELQQLKDEAKADVIENAKVKAYYWI